MANKIQAIHGMHDILPDQSSLWQRAEHAITEVLATYGYSEIRLPVVEKTELFKRSIGEVTDIVEKEMYTFDDRNGDSLTLRPEGTAGCVRSALEHGLLHNQLRRLWYYGPMFRRERPQKGRYRQFYQLGVEAYGMDGPDIDAELILLSNRFWNKLGIQDKVVLEINTLGTIEERLVYREDLVQYFEDHREQLDQDSLRRLKTNPLRILDSKNPDMQSLISSAPTLEGYLKQESKEHFQVLLEHLDSTGVNYRINNRLVRGLDYYSKTVFEWVTEDLGAQGTICAGGRYDTLVSQLGGKEIAAIGFAMGMERILALMETLSVEVASDPIDVYMIRVGLEAEKLGLQFAEKIRDKMPALKLQVNCGGGSFKNQFKKADKSGAQYALIIGEDEVSRQEVAIKPLRHDGEQQNMSLNSAIEVLIQSRYRKSQ